MVERRERHNCCASTNSHHTHSANRHLGGGSRFGSRFVRFSPPSATALGAQVPAALSPPQGLACARRARGAAQRPGGAMDNQQQKRVFLDFLDQQGYMEEVHGMLGRQVGPVPGYG